MQSKAKTVAEYLKELPPDRREAISAVRKVILDNLPTGFEECMNYGMIGYVVPHSIFPAGYHVNPAHPLPFVNLGSQKNGMSLYLMTVYGPLAEWFRDEWKKTGKKLDMGKSCVRFKKLDDLPLELIGRTIAKVPLAEYVAFCESAVRDRKPVPRSEIRAKAKAKAAAKLKAKPRTKIVAKAKVAAKKKAATRR